MKTAVIGSRSIIISKEELQKYIPKNTTEIVSGGAKGVDTTAKEFAIANNLKMQEFLPDYKKYKKAAPLKRNLQIIEYADCVIALWNGKSKGTQFVINKCHELNKPITIYIFEL